MSSPPNELWNDDWIEQLVQFDEALRMGRAPAPNAPLDPQFQDTQQFLLLLQSVWPRAPKKIGPYTLVNSLGQGTVGPSYLVEDPVSRQRCVLKILWPDLSAHPQTRQQFVRDAKAVVRLRHANIAAVREVRDSGPLCIVVSDYAPGSSLALWRRKKPQPLAWEVASALIVRLADILEFAHREGISHGNLKSSNIFLASTEEITPDSLPQATLRVSDFALAKAVQQTRLPSQAGLAWPMPQYLAPEQLQHRSQPPEPASDLYSLGVIWYDLLTGRCPVQGTTKEEIYARTFDAVPTPRHYRPEVPSEVELLVLQCLHKMPRERPASAQHLADALRRLLPNVVEQKSPAWWKRWLGWS
jgi:serine/threonine protein kinase